MTELSETRLGEIALDGAQRIHRVHAGRIISSGSWFTASTKVETR